MWWAIKCMLLLILHACNASKRPHIVFIMGDDIGWNDVGFHGSDQIPTPNIDALGYSGFLLNHHYVEAICTPSRAALMTGRYPSKLGMQSIPIGGAEKRALPKGKILPEYLKDLGYKTSLIGKWHLGFYKEEFTPLRRGFDEFFGYYNGLIGYYDHIYQDPEIKPKEICREGRSGLTWDFTTGPFLNGLDLHRNTTPARDMDGRYATDVFTEEAVRLIHNHDPSSPLFLYLAHVACHAGNWGQNLEAPLEVKDKLKHIKDPNRRTYAAMMWKLDESVGKVVKALKEREMLENCIILFVSDNGGPTVLSGSWQTPASNYPLRGVKLTQWEGGVRTPALLWSSLLQRKEHVSQHLMHISDWLPTLYSAAGGNPQDLEGVPLDGVNQWEALVHNTPSQRDEILVMFDDLRNVTGVRKGDWKLVEGSNLLGVIDEHYGDDGKSESYPQYNVSKIYCSDAGEAVNSIRPLPEEDIIHEIRDEATIFCPKQVNVTKCDLFRNQKPCLFNLAKDPCEVNDLSLSYPDKVEQLIDLRKKLSTPLIPSRNRLWDVVKANPERFNNTWEPWGNSACEDTVKETQISDIQGNYQNGGKKFHISLINWFLCIGLTTHILFKRFVINSSPCPTVFSTLIYS